MNKYIISVQITLFFYNKFTENSTQFDMVISQNHKSQQNEITFLLHSWSLYNDCCAVTSISMFEI